MYSQNHYFHFSAGPFKITCLSDDPFLNTLSGQYSEFFCDKGYHAFFTFSETPFCDSTNVFSVFENSSEYIMRNDFKVCVFPEKALICCAPNPYSFNSALRVLCSLVFPLQNCIMVHGASISYAKNGFCMAGKSGAGKSTFARMVTNTADVLTDEISIIEKRSDSWVIHSSPFWGEMQPGSYCTPAPLKSLFFLRPDTTDLFSSLLSCILFFSKQHALNQKTFFCAAELYEEKSCGIFSFNLDDSEKSLVKKL